MIYDGRKKVAITDHIIHKPKTKKYMAFDFTFPIIVNPIDVNINAQIENKSIFEISVFNVVPNFASVKKNAKLKFVKLPVIIDNTVSRIFAIELMINVNPTTFKILVNSNPALIILKHNR
jgi:hypothetical protein